MKSFSKLIKEATEEEFVYLADDFISDYFGDIKDIGYSYGYQGYYNHNKNIIGTYFIDRKNGSKTPASFILYFYKILDKSLYRQISEIIEDIKTFNECIEQYRNCDELADYNFSGIAIRDKGDPNYHNVQTIEILFQHQRNK